MNDLAILVPCYNAAKYLPRLAKAISEQKVPFDELICFDDGSLDDTAKVAKDLGFKVVRSEKNFGPAYARNQLANATQAKWLHFHDADDLLTNDYVEKVKPLFDESCDVIVCNADWVDENHGGVILERRYKQEAFDVSALAYTISNPIGVISVCCRRSSFLAINGYDESLRCWEDGDLHVRLAASGARFKVIEEVLAFSMRNWRGISSNEKLCAKARLKVLENYTESFLTGENRELKAVIASEAELAARALIMCNEVMLAKQAIKLSKHLGISVPSTSNLLLKLLRFLFPAHMLLRIQMKIRAYIG